MQAGGVAYFLQYPAILVTLNHCDDTRRATGTPNAIWDDAQGRRAIRTLAV